MVIEGSSDIIISNQVVEKQSQRYQCLLLRDEKVLVLSAQSIGLYENLDKFLDPLADGCIAYQTLPDLQELDWVNDTLIESYKAGFVALADGKTMLITPSVIHVFASREAALSNRDTLLKLHF